ncbi:hypothetical protein, partial [Enterobacter hormaechei]
MTSALMGGGWPPVVINGQTRKSAYVWPIKNPPERVMTPSVVLMFVGSKTLVSPLILPSDQLLRCNAFVFCIPTLP